MKLSRLSLRTRIFLSMILLVLVASILIAAVSIFQYKEEAEEYHQDRLERKEERIKVAIKNVLRSTTYPITEENIALIFRENNRIYQVAEEHSLPVNIYDLSGKLLIQSDDSFFDTSKEVQLPKIVMDSLSTNFEKRYLVKFDKDGEKFLSSYTYISDVRSKPLAILKLPYLENDDLIVRELIEFLKRLGTVYVVLMLFAILVAFILSKYITRSLKVVSETIDQTRFDTRNKRIEIEEAGGEIYDLVQAYNSMIDQLEDSAAQLAKSEREAAWREMAKQVAHEIKNPLTPMRLTVQSFERKFNPEDPEIRQKIKEYSATLIQQIDTMSAIASAFSNFAKMPAQKTETLDVVNVVRLALDIFNESYIQFLPKDESVIAKFDRTQLIRVLTNLVKNGIQAIPEKQENKRILVEVFADNDEVVIKVVDNGVGIEETHKNKIFEPKFTTKTSGMGLGLGMVKNIVETYDGSITFTSQSGKGTVFTVRFPKL